MTQVERFLDSFATFVQVFGSGRGANGFALDRIAAAVGPANLAIELDHFRAAYEEVFHALPPEWPPPWVRRFVHQDVHGTSRPCHEPLALDKSSPNYCYVCGYKLGDHLTERK